MWHPWLVGQGEQPKEAVQVHSFTAEVTVDWFVPSNLIPAFD
jgi:hypothetical protein